MSYLSSIDIQKEIDKLILLKNYMAHRKTFSFKEQMDIDNKIAELEFKLMNLNKVA